MLDNIKVRSPITGLCDVTEISKIKVEYIIKNYFTEFGIDVSKCFNGLDDVTVYQCNETGYKFYYPFTIAGDSEFYENLYGNEKNIQWAYQDDKWEHLFAENYLVDPGRLLDVGCGGGDFLKLMNKKHSQITGLDTNNVAVDLSAEKEMKIISDTIENHAKTMPEQYDTVTLFQVLEHVPNVNAFLTDCLATIKQGGRLIISVPNNKSFLRYNPELLLNMPPHHVGLWDRESLEQLPKFFDMTLIRMEFEPLQELNLGWYQSLMEKKYLPKNIFFRSLYYRFRLNGIASAWLTENRDTIWGHTVLAVFQKNG